MGKTVAAIGRALYGPVLGLIIDGKKGFIRGLENAAIAYTGPLTYGAYVASAGLQSLAKVPKPDTTVTALKSPLTPRIRAYGRSRLYGNYDLFVTASSGVAIDVVSILETGGNEIDGVETIYLGDQVVATSAGTVAGLSDGTYGNSAVSVYFRLGAATETAYSQVISELPGIWTSAHRGDGCVTAAVLWKPVKAKDYQKVYPNGQPAISLVARWLRVFDWRDEAQSVDDPSTWTWTENALLHLADYILTVEKAERSPGEMFPSAASLQSAWDRYFAPTLASWTVAADDCDAARPLRLGGSEHRYRSCLSHRLTDAHKDTKARLLACFDGWLAPREDGALVVYSGHFYTPTVSLGPDEIVAYSLQAGVEDENAVNDIAVTYVSAENGFSTVEADNWTNEADIIERASIRSESLQNDVPSHAQARALAKRKMIQLMAPQRGTVTTNSGGRVVRGHRFVDLLLQESGRVFYSGSAEITSMTRNLGTGGVTFNWIAMSPAVDIWNPATEESGAVPGGTPVDPSDLVAPVITGAVASFGQDSATNSSGVRIFLTIDAPDRDDLTWYVRTRATGAATWDERTYSDLDPGPSVSIITEFVATDAMIEVETAYQVGDGRTSDWSATETVDTSTAGLSPAAPAGLSATGGAGSALIEWTNATANFSYTRIYRGTTSSFGSASLISGDISGSAGSAQSYTDTVAAGTYFWWAIAFSAAGAASSTSGPVTAVVS